MEPWKEKAHSLVAQMAMTAYRESNYHDDGSKYKKHRPYTVPDTAKELVRLIGANDEVGAKRLFWKILVIPELLSE